MSVVINTSKYVNNTLYLYLSPSSLYLFFFWVLLTHLSVLITTPFCMHEKGGKKKKIIGEEEKETGGQKFNEGIDDFSPL